MLFRVLKQGADKAAREMEPWVKLALMEVVPAKDSGPFNPMTGAFFNSKFDDHVPFYAVPSPIFNDEPGRTLAGGRVILDIKGLVDSKGKIVMLRSGDQIEYYIEVLGRTREPATAIPVGRSETRIVNVVTIEEFLRWVQEAQREAERIRKLEQRQRELFKRK